MFCEIMRLRPKPGARERLLEIREPLVAGYAAKDGFVGVRMVEVEYPELPPGFPTKPKPEGETWVDIWYWESFEAAHAATTDPPAEFNEWMSLIESVDMDFASVLSDHGG